MAAHHWERKHTAIETYNALQDYLRKSRDGLYRRYRSSRAVIIHRVNLGIAVKYHETDVLVFKEDGAIVLNSGGWRTVTTKFYMNEFLPFRYEVVQSKYVWRVQINNYNSVPFQDGMVLPNTPQCSL